MNHRNKTRPARKSPASWYVLEGDWGGQVYATVPTKLVRARDAKTRLRTALRMLDQVCWPCNEGGGASVLLNAQTPTDLTSRSWNARESRVRGWTLAGEVFGGMGGGRLVRGDLWLHVEVLGRGLPLVNRIRALLGLRPLASLRVTWAKYDAGYAPAGHPLRLYTVDGPIEEVE